jgi:hypothetical protein
MLKPDAQKTLKDASNIPVHKHYDARVEKNIGECQKPKSKATTEESERVNDGLNIRL